MLQMFYEQCHMASIAYELYPFSSLQSSANHYGHVFV